MIAVEAESTAGAFIGSGIQGHVLPMMAPAAILTRIGRIDSNVLAPSLFRFGSKLVEEFRPGGIMNALSKTVIVSHAVHAQIFHADDPVAVHKTAAFLVCEVITPEGDTLMHPRYCFAVLTPFWCPFGKLGMLPLHTGQGLLFFPEEARVFNRFTSRECSKGLESDINPNLLRPERSAFRFALDREAGIPLACTALVDGQRFDLPTYRAMVDHLDAARFRETDAVIMRDGKARLWERETIIPATALETRVARVPCPFSTSAEEGLEGQIKAYRNILQNLRMHLVQGRLLLFQDRIGGLLLVECEALAFLLVGSTPFLKQMVIEPTAFLENIVELLFFLLAWVDAILKHFTHNQIINLNRTAVEEQRYPGAHAPLKDSPFIPAHECGGLLAWVGKHYRRGPQSARVAEHTIDNL
jgi:hypothetical protein